jgi:uncharacterized protein (TIGR02217 family)
MMSFEEIQFPTDISYGATGGPIFLTDVVATVSGHEQRNSKWQHQLERLAASTGREDRLHRTGQSMGEWLQ